MFFMSDLFGEELQGDALTSFGKLVQITEQLTVGLSAFWCFLMLSEGRLVTRLASCPFLDLTYQVLPGLILSFAADWSTGMEHLQQALGIQASKNLRDRGWFVQHRKG